MSCDCTVRLYEFDAGGLSQLFPPKADNAVKENFVHALCASHKTLWQKICKQDAQTRCLRCCPKSAARTTHNREQQAQTRCLRSCSKSATRCRTTESNRRQSRKAFFVRCCLKIGFYMVQKKADIGDFPFVCFLFITLHLFYFIPAVFAEGRIRIQFCSAAGAETVFISRRSNGVLNRCIIRV